LEIKIGLEHKGHHELIHDSKKKILKGVKATEFGPLAGKRREIFGKSPFLQRPGHGPPQSSLGRGRRASRGGFCRRKDPQKPPRSTRRGEKGDGEKKSRVPGKKKQLFEGDFNEEPRRRTIPSREKSPKTQTWKKKKKGLGKRSNTKRGFRGPLRSSIKDVLGASRRRAQEMGDQAEEIVGMGRPRLRRGGSQRKKTDAV